MDVSQTIGVTAEDARRMGKEAEKVKERFSIQAVTDAWIE